MKVVATYNIKGGVGKTSTAVNVAHLAARDGRRTLLWDLDPQGAATYVFRVKPKVKGGGRRLVDRRTPRRRGRSRPPTSTASTSCRPTSRTATWTSTSTTTSGRRAGCGRLLRPLAGDYDLVVLDCPPSISLVSESVMDAADLLLVPLIPTTLSLNTFDQLTSFVRQLRRRPARRARRSSRWSTGASGCTATSWRRRRRKRATDRQDGDPGPVGHRADGRAAGAGDGVVAARPGGGVLRGVVDRDRGDADDMTRHRHPPRGRDEVRRRRWLRAAGARRRAGVAADEPVVQHLDAEYFDTADLRLLRRSIALRRRTGGDDAGWHLKMQKTLGERIEVRRPLGDDGRRRAEAARATLLTAHVRDHQLAPVARLRTKRHVHRLLAPNGEPVAEIADDHVRAETLDADDAVAGAGGRARRRRRRRPAGRRGPAAARRRRPPGRGRLEDRQGARRVSCRPRTTRPPSTRRRRRARRSPRTCASRSPR